MKDDGYKVTKCINEKRKVSKLFRSTRVQRDISVFLENFSILESRSFQGPSRGNRVQRDISRSWELVADGLAGFYFMPAAGCPTNMFAGQYSLVAHHNVYKIVQSLNVLQYSMLHFAMMYCQTYSEMIELIGHWYSGQLPRIYLSQLASSILLP